MTSGNSYITNIILFIVLIITFEIYIRVFFKRREGVWFNVIAMGFWIVLWIFENRFTGGFINTLLHTTLFVSLSIICYKGSIFYKSFLCIMYIVVWVNLELFVVFLIQDLDMINILGEVISKVLLLLLVCIMRCYFNNNYISDIPKRHIIVLLIIPITSMIIYCGIYTLIPIAYTGNKIIFTLFALLGLLIINIIVFYYYRVMLRDMEIKKVNIIYENQLHLIETHNKENLKSTQKMHELRHNYLNDMVVINAYLVNHDYRQAQKLVLNSINTVESIHTGISQTGNIFVDSIINSRYFIARNTSIDFKTDLMVPSDLNIRGSDLSLILGNVLDNAVEATLKLLEKERFIIINAKYERGCFMINIINSFTGIVRRNKEGNLLSIKKDNVDHGFGLRAVQKAVDNYNGYFDVEIKDTVFICRILLYVSKEKLHE